MTYKLEQVAKELGPTKFMRGLLELVGEWEHSEAEPFTEAEIDAINRWIEDVTMALSLMDED